VLPEPVARAPQGDTRLSSQVHPQRCQLAPASCERPPWASRVTGRRGRSTVPGLERPLDGPDLTVA